MDGAGNNYLLVVSVDGLATGLLTSIDADESNPS